MNNADLFLHNLNGKITPIDKWLLSAEYPWGVIKDLNRFVHEVIVAKQMEYGANKEDFVPWSLKIRSHENCVLEPNIGEPEEKKENPIIASEGFILTGHHTKIESFAYLKGNIIIGDNCTIESGVRITGNVVIGNNVHIYHGATITGSSPQTDMPQSVWIGNDVKIYQGSIIKASIILDNCRVYSNCYIGASVVGKNVLIGSGVKMVDAKFRQKNQMIIIRHPLETIDTELTKFGGAIGNNVEIGSNVTIYPGTIILPDSSILPNDTVQDIYDRKIK
jgi:NDP-sugar pyrophosphorylase family protein